MKSALVHRDKEVEKLTKQILVDKNSQEDGITNRIIFQEDIHLALSDQQVTSTIVEDESDDGNSTPEPTRCFTYMISSILSAIVKDAYTQLQCLEQCNTKLMLLKILTNQDHLKDLKYNVKQFVVKDELEGIDKKKLNCDLYKLNKLDADRQFVRDALQNLYKEVAINMTFGTLRSNVQQLHDRFLYVYTLEADEVEHRAIRRDLSRQLRQQRNRGKSMIYETNVTIDNLKAKTEDFVVRSKIDTRYTGNWQTAREEQNKCNHFNEESLQLKNIAKFKERAEHEQRVHTEVELFLNIAINETLLKVEEWMDKYDRDMENIDLKIQIKKNEYQNMLDKRREMEEKYKKHDRLIKDWVHFKEEREKAHIYCDNITKSAIIVQAWWRGLLVRLQLGPYTVKKAKSGKNKKKLK